MLDEITQDEDLEWALTFSFADFEDAVEDGVIEVADGCMVELDGTCPHGHKSPFLVLGSI